MDKIKVILDKYNSDDAKAFHDTVEMLCSKGVANGCYQDFSMLIDVIAILGVCETILEKKVS